MVADDTPPTVPKPIKIFIVFWLALVLLGALNHNIFLNIIGRIDFNLLPHIRYGYVMFNKSPATVPVIAYQPANHHAWIHISELVNTPSFGYKRSRVLIDVMFTQFDYLLALCIREERANGATFVIQHHAPGFPERRADTRYVCQQQRLYPAK